MTTSKKGIYGGTLLLALILGSVIFFRSSDPTPERLLGRVLVNDIEYRLEVADTDATRSLGLGERASLCERCGMLFVFPSARRYGFWMKGMQFPIDIAWLQDDVVVHVVRRVSETSTEVYMPERTANRVLEFNAGVLEDIHVGERLVFLPEE